MLSDRHSPGDEYVFLSFTGWLYALVLSQQLFSFIHMASTGVSRVLDEVMNCRDLGQVHAGTKNFVGFAVGGRALIMLSAERYWHISCLMLWRYLLFHVFSSADLLPVMSWERESLKVRRRGTGKKIFLRQ